MTWAGTASAIGRVVGAVLPDLVDWVVSLFDEGKSEDEAVEIINIRSRRREYEEAKAEDRRALDDKTYGEDSGD